MFKRTSFAINKVVCAAASLLLLLLLEADAQALYAPSSSLLWPNGHVPVCFTQHMYGLPGYHTFSQMFTKEAKRWANVARIDITYSVCPSSCVVTTNAAGATLWSGCPSGTVVLEDVGPWVGTKGGIGYDPNGPRVILFSTTQTSPYGVTHEFGHALGFDHENYRPDNTPSNPGYCVNDAQNGCTGSCVPRYFNTSMDKFGIMSYCRLDVDGYSENDGRLSQQDVIGVKGAYGAREGIGVFRNGLWFLDANGDGIYNTGDKFFGFGQAGDKPAVVSARGAFDERGPSSIAIYRNGTWSVDQNRNGSWDPSDPTYHLGGAGNWPVTGSWPPNSRDSIGVFGSSGDWYLDRDDDHVWHWSDYLFWYGQNGDIPVVGQWTFGYGHTQIGIYRQGVWALDLDGDGAWEPTDRNIASFGGPNGFPVVGDWDGDGTDNIGVFENGIWYLDFNGNGVWDPSATMGDVGYSFGQLGDIPVVGNW